MKVLFFVFCSLIYAQISYGFGMRWDLDSVTMYCDPHFSDIEDAPIYTFEVSKNQSDNSYSVTTYEDLLDQELPTKLSKTVHYSNVGNEFIDIQLKELTLKANFLNSGFDMVETQAWKIEGFEINLEEGNIDALENISSSTYYCRPTLH